MPSPNARRVRRRNRASRLRMEHACADEFLSTLPRVIALVVASLLATAEEPEPRLPLRTRVVLAGVISGAAVAGTGIGLRFAAGGNYDRIDRGYPAFHSYEELRATRRLGELEQSLSLAFLIAGAVVLAVTAVLSFIL